MTPTLDSLHRLHLISQKKWINKSVDIEIGVYIFLGALGFLAGAFNAIPFWEKIILVGALWGAALAVHLNSDKDMNKKSVARLMATFLISSLFFMSFTMALHLAQVLLPKLHTPGITALIGITAGLLSPSIASSLQKQTRPYFHPQIINAKTFAKILNDIQVFANLHPIAHHNKQIILSISNSPLSNQAKWQLHALKDNTLQEIPLPHINATPDTLTKLSTFENEMEELKISSTIAPLSHHQILILHQDVKRLFPNHEFIT